MTGKNARQDAAPSKELMTHAGGDRRRSILRGMAAAVGLLTFYLGVLFRPQSWEGSPPGGTAAARR